MPMQRSRKNEVEYDYGVMMDAGSTGTRCYIYRWPRQYTGDVPKVEPLMAFRLVAPKAVALRDRHKKQERREQCFG